MARTTPARGGAAVVGRCAVAGAVAGTVGGAVAGTVAGWFDPVACFWFVATAFGAVGGALVTAAAGALMSLLLLAAGRAGATVPRWGALVLLAAVSTAAAGAWAWVLVFDALIDSGVQRTGVGISVLVAGVAVLACGTWALRGAPRRAA